MRHHSAVLPALLLALGLATMGTGCKKKNTDPPPKADRVPVQDVESRLQITSMSPGRIKTNHATDLRVYGAAFEEGATVSIGGNDVPTVTYVDPNTLSFPPPRLPVGKHDVVVRNPDGTTASLRAGLSVESSAVTSVDCSFASIPFGFDTAGLDADGRQQLDSYMICYQQKTGAIQVAGHADERGTTDYNLSLGQRRANTVKAHLTGQGVSRGRVKAVSFGEERPAQRGSNERAYTANRRVEVSAE